MEVFGEKEVRLVKVGGEIGEVETIGGAWGLVGKRG